MTDEELVTDFQNGNIKAFDKLFEKYSSSAVKTAYLITGNNLCCDDIVQETFIKCYNSLNKLKNPKLFKAWFYKILTNTAIRHKQKFCQGISIEDISDYIQYKFSYKNDFSENYNTNSELFENVKKLSKSQRTAIILYYFNGFSIKEIAKITNSLEATVKSRLFLAKRKLKQFYTKGLDVYER